MLSSEVPGRAVVALARTVLSQPLPGAEEPSEAVVGAD